MYLNVQEAVAPRVLRIGGCALKAMKVGTREEQHPSWVIPGSICQLQYEWGDPGRSGNTWQIVNDGIYALAGGKTISCSMSG
jgi:hypothetical protein